MKYVYSVGASGIEALKFPLYIDYDISLNRLPDDKYFKCWVLNRQTSTMNYIILKDGWVELVDTETYTTFKLSFDELLSYDSDTMQSIYGYKKHNRGFIISVFTRVLDVFDKHTILNELLCVRSDQVDRYSTLAYCCMQPSNLIYRVNKRGILYFKANTPELKVPFSGNIKSFTVELMKQYALGDRNRIMEGNKWVK